MTEYALILVGTVLVNNFVLVKFLGLCPFMGVSKKLETAIGMGLATTFVMTLSAVCTWMVNEYVLEPLGIEYLRTIAFILVIAAVVQFTETVMRKTSPVLYQVLGIFLPLITTNCAVLGVALLNPQAGHAWWSRPSTASARRSGSPWSWSCSPPCASASPWPTCPSPSRAAPSP